MHDMQRFSETRHVLILWLIRMSRCLKNQKDKIEFCKNKILQLLAMQTTFDFRGFSITALITPFLAKPNSSCLSFVFFLKKKQTQNEPWQRTKEKHRQAKVTHWLPAPRRHLHTKEMISIRRRSCINPQTVEPIIFTSYRRWGGGEGWGGGGQVRQCQAGWQLNPHRGYVSSSR